MKDQEKPLLSIKQVAERLQISQATVLKLIQTGDLTAHRVGDQWRIKPEEVEIYLRKVANTQT